MTGRTTEFEHRRSTEVEAMKLPSDTTIVEYDQPGDPTVLRVRRGELRPPGDGEVTVEVVTAGISHIDAYVRSGAEKDWDDPFPRRSGSDFAGIVVAAGAGTAGFPVNSEVIGHVRSGAQAAFLTVGIDRLVRRPPTVTWEIAGGLYLAGVTALDTLDDLKIGSDDTVVISAAAGGVGSIEAQIAKHRGARVVGTCGRRNFDYLRQLGITPVQYGDGMADRIRAAAPAGVTAFIDNFGQDGHALAADLGVPAGKFRSSAARREVEMALLAEDAASVAHGTQQLEKITALAARRAFTLLISGHYALDDVAEAYADLQKLHSRGKVVLGTKPVNPRRITKARDIAEARA
ncbi:MAG: NADP-dependent oxidoreductase [Actinobacteria bacterium]|nr:NADP-dependent oxidoreductase [Actinomycetota bacterium]